MSAKESLLYPSIVSSFRRDVSLFDIEEHLSQSERDFHFAMRCNGYFLLKDKQWVFDPNTIKPFVNEFQGQRVSFFGPNGTDNFFSGKNIKHDRFVDAFSQKPIIDTISKYRGADEDQAARIAFLFGGIVRHLFDKSAGEITRAVKFAARMTMLGERHSADAIASASAMYIISGGSLDEDRDFVGQLYHMSEAIREDPILPLETKDLGLSQAARLRAFRDMIQDKEHRPFPDTAEYEMAFDKFPTVGAEFHFPPDAARGHLNFWKRLAILNMSQYQRGSYVQLSRNDRGVIEVRMNPSIYPVTIANSNYMRLLLPELNQAFFTITINRKDGREDFSWQNKDDKNLLNNLRALGMLSYAGMFENIPHTEKPEEINFGVIYLGQTVRMVNGEYKFTGLWSGGEGNHGQMGIYAGFGNTLPYLAYYLSMSLADPDIFGSVHKDFWARIKTLKDALAVSPADRRHIFRKLQDHVEADKGLNKTHVAGNRIIELLNP